MAKLAFLGTGLIGSGLAEAALSRGDDVTVYNRTAAKAAPLVALGATLAETAAAAVVGQERVHLAVSDDNAVASLLAAAGPDLNEAVVVDHTTTGPVPTRERAERLAKEGTAYVHAPVFMSPTMCKSAGGLMLASASKEHYARVEAGLGQMTGSVKYVGEDMARAASLKLFGNAMILTITAGLSDVFTMAKSLGIDPEEARSLFDVFNPGGTLQNRGKKMAAGDFTPSFELSMARKDTRLMLEAAGPDAALAILPALYERMGVLIDSGHGQEDVGVLAIDGVS